MEAPAYPRRIYFWKVRDALTGRMRRTTYRMSEEDAKAMCPEAERIECGWLELTAPLGMRNWSPK